VATKAFMPPCRPTNDRYSTRNFTRGQPIRRRRSQSICRSGIGTISLVQKRQPINLMTSSIERLILQGECFAMKRVCLVVALGGYCYYKAARCTAMAPAMVTVMAMDTARIMAALATPITAIARAVTMGRVADMDGAGAMADGRAVGAVIVGMVGWLFRWRWPWWGFGGGLVMAGLCWLGGHGGGFGGGGGHGGVFGGGGGHGGGFAGGVVMAGLRRQRRSWRWLQRRWWPRQWASLSLSVAIVHRFAPDQPTPEPLENSSCCVTHNPRLHLTLIACSTIPSGPSALVLPAAHKNATQFRTDDAACREFAHAQLVATPHPPQSLEEGQLHLISAICSA